MLVFLAGIAGVLGTPATVQGPIEYIVVQR